MNSMPHRRWVSLLVGCAAAGFGLAATCPADVLPEPRPIDVGGLQADVRGNRARPVALHVEEDRTAAIHRLEIPAAVLTQLAGGGRPATSLAAAGTIRSVVAGIALSAAVAFGFVAYRRGRAARLATVVLCGLAVAGGGGYFAATVWADIPPGMPPLSQQEVLARLLQEVGPAGKVVVETAKVGEDEVVLILGTKAADAK
jgi:hypothetical protein